MTSSDLIGAIILIAYYAVICAVIPVLLKRTTRAPSEIIRKIQHVGYSLSVFLLLTLFSTWYAAIAAAALLVVVAWPALWAMEKFSWYRRSFVDRAARGGELRSSMIQVQIAFSILIVIFWALLGEDWKPIIGVAAMAWGFGDAAAALVGKAWGRRHVLNRFVDSAKTYEGTFAMMVFAGTALFWSLRFYADQSWWASLLIAILVAPISGVVELFSRRGTDTLTVPLFTAFSILPLIHMFAWLGW